MDDVVAVVLGFIAIAAAVAGYLFGSFLLLTLVLPPVVFFVAAIGAATGLVVMTVAGAQALSNRAVLIAPATYRDERVARKPLKRGKFPPDTAFALYPVRQWHADVVRVAERASEICRGAWRWRVWSLLGVHDFDNAMVWWVWPLPMLTIVFLIATVGTLVVAYVLFLVVAGAVALAVSAVLGVMVLFLRAVEGGWRRLVRAQASCPHCYEVRPRPAYRCPGCRYLHRDIRPGRLGVLFRRCECGVVLPTMVLRAAWRLEAVCQVCKQPLRKGAAAVRDVRIPIFGDTSAGKTRFLYAALDSIMEHAKKAGVDVTFPDAESKRVADVALDVLRSGKDTAKTSPGALPPALSCVLGSGMGSSLIHLFDCAGENFAGPEMHDSLSFLHAGHGLVYVLDPFSIGRVQDKLAGRRSVTMNVARAAVGDPERAYGEVVNRIRDSGVKASDQRLAIVLSKIDILSSADIEAPTDSDAIGNWLREFGLHNLVAAAGREFSAVRYFAVASVAFCEDGRRDAGTPLAWLMSELGVRLPQPRGVSETVS